MSTQNTEAANLQSDLPISIPPTYVDDESTDKTFILTGTTLTSDKRMSVSLSTHSSISHNGTRTAPANEGSIGIWSGTKSAASTPNLTNVSMNSDFLGPYPLKGVVSGLDSAGQSISKPIPPPGSTTKPSSGIKSTTQNSGTDSLNQRRKRSESISGIKTSAGNITRMVRKGSVSFLKKIAKSFDDKDAPPIPTMPTSHSSYSIHSAHSTTALSTMSHPEFINKEMTDPPPLPPMPPIAVGPMDSPTSALTSISVATSTTSVSVHASATDDLNSQAQIDSSDFAGDDTNYCETRESVNLDNPSSVTSIESWLKNTQIDNGDMIMDHDEVEQMNTSSKEADTGTSLQSNNSISSIIMTAKKQVRHPVQIPRRSSHTSSVSTMDDGDSDLEDIAIPISVLALNSNRLSKIHETALVDINDPLLDGANPQNSAGDEFYVNPRRLTASNARSSILFSEFGLVVTEQITPSKRDSAPIRYVVAEEKSLAKRPASMFTTSNSTPIFSGRNEQFSANTIAEDPAEHHIGASNLPSPLQLTDSHTHTLSSNLYISPQKQNPNTLIENLSVPALGSAGARPATICFGAEDAHKLAPPISVIFNSVAIEAPATDLNEALAIQNAVRCFQEDESFLSVDAISVYLGQAKPFNNRVLNIYMRNFDFSRKRLDIAFRQLCQKLVLKGETQEVDRVLEAFAKRYVECNPQSIFGDKDVVHAITYSILLLNTDLHVVQQSNLHKMSRSAFVKNTLQVVQAHTARQLEEQALDDISIHGGSFARSISGEVGSNARKKRSASIKSWRSGTSHQSKNSKMGYDPKANGGYGNGKWWMSELESVLKDIHSSVKHHQISLPLQTSKTPASKNFASGLSYLHPGSNNASSTHMTLSQSMGSIGDYGSGSGVRSSIDTRNKQSKQTFSQKPIVPSFESGKVNGIFNSDESHVSGSTLPIPITSSVHSHLSTSDLPSPVSSSFFNSDLQQQAISISDRAILPDHYRKFRKEGILYRKHLLERTDKRASNRSWRQLLVVVENGGLSLFRVDGLTGHSIDEQGQLFDEIQLQHTITNILPPPGYSSSRKHVFAVQLYTGAVYLFQTSSSQECDEWARACNFWAARTSKEPLVGGVVNMDYGWGRSLELLSNISTDKGDSVTTSKSMTSIHTVPSLTSPMLSSSSTLTSVSNVSEHSTSTVVPGEDESKLLDTLMVDDGLLQTPLLSTSPSASVNNSLIEKSVLSSNGYGSGSGRTASIKSTSSKYGKIGSSSVPLGDRVMLFEWSPPLPAMNMSQLCEEDQCKALKKYVLGLESEMEVHQEYRTPMMKLFLPKSHNYSKAFNNWERRSRYLLKEMVKYQIYVECLEQSLQSQIADQIPLSTVNLENVDSESELQHLDVTDSNDEMSESHPNEPEATEQE